MDGRGMEGSPRWVKGKRDGKGIQRETEFVRSQKCLGICYFSEQLDMQLLGRGIHATAGS